MSILRATGWLPFAFCVLGLMAPAASPLPGQDRGSDPSASEPAGLDDFTQQDAQLEARVREIASELRCPTCRSLSVYDSPSDMAQEMRGLIREQLQAGKTEEEIKAYFVDRYGEWILLAPKARGFNWMVWLLPLVIGFGGLAFVIYTARRWVQRGREEAALIENVDSEV